MAQLRAMPPFKTTVEWKIWYLTGVLKKSVAVTKPDGSPGARKKVLRPQASGTRVDYSVKAAFAAAGRKYRITQACDSSMPEEAYAASYDGAQFRFHLMAASELQYSRKQRRELLDNFFSPVQLAPFEFASRADSQRAQSDLAWPDLFDEEQLQRRLAMGVPGSLDTPAGKRRFVTFDVSTKSEATPLVYRVFVDRPDGQPSEIDKMDRKGSVWTATKFEYAEPKGIGFAIPVGLESVYYDEDGKVGCSMTAKTTKLEIDPKLPEDAFTIDFVSANTVMDLDAGKPVKNEGLEPPPQPRSPTPADGDRVRRPASAPQPPKN